MSHRVNNKTNDPDFPILAVAEAGAYPMQLISEVVQELKRLSEFSAKALAPSVALVNYSSILRHVDGSETHSLRSSIWARTGKGWKLVFHQGTPAIPAKE